MFTPLFYSSRAVTPLPVRVNLLSFRVNSDLSLRVGSTVGSIQVADLVAALQALGADSVGLCKRAGLSATVLRDPAARVPSARVLALFETAARELRDPLIGLHAGAHSQPRGPLFYLLLSSARSSDALQAFVRFARVTIDTLEMQIEQRPGTVELLIDPGDPALRASHHAVDYILGADVCSLRRTIPGFRLLGVDVVHEEVGEPGETARVFGCPVRFGCRANVLRMPDATLHGTPSGANPLIAEQIEGVAATLLEGVETARGRDRVAHAINQMLMAGLPPDRATVARRLHMSVRTLQRLLEEESTTFKLVRDEVRAELSHTLLSDRGLKVATIARSLGYAEVASFSKAFTRWSGHSPSRYRAMAATRGSGQGRLGRPR